MADTSTLTLTTSILDLTLFPPPAVIEETPFQSIYLRMVQEFIAIDPQYGHLLESDPAVKLIQSYAYREYLLRQRINEASRAQMLAFANGSDLDHLGGFYGVTRNPDEPDDQLRERIRLRIVGFSAAGPAEAYKYFALTASALVLDAQVSSPEPGVVTITLLSGETETGEASADLVSSVQDVVGADNVRVLTDTVQVKSCDLVPVPVIASITLGEATPAETIALLETSFPQAFAEHRGLGQDITTSWIIGELQKTGVYSVDLVSPAADTVVDDESVGHLSQLTLTFAGRAR